MTLGVFGCCSIVQIVVDIRIVVDNRSIACRTTLPRSSSVFAGSRTSNAYTFIDWSSVCWSPVGSMFWAIAWATCFFHCSGLRVFAMLPPVDFRQHHAAYLSPEPKQLARLICSFRLLYHPIGWGCNWFVLHIVLRCQFSLFRECPMSALPGRPRCLWWLHCAGVVVRCCRLSLSGFQPVARTPRTMPQ